jgi:prolyl oligopeptidase
MPTWNYPPARTVDHADDYHGTLVPDPYRWLEDMQSKEVLAWAKAQTNLAESALRGGVWEEVRARVEQLADYPKVGMPRRSKDGALFYTYNDGLRPQPVIVRQRTPDAEREAVLDVNSLSADGTVAVPVYSVSPDGKTLAYAVADGGSDWNDVRFRDVSSGQDLPDQLTRTRYATLGWLADSSGFYYARYPDHTGEAMREGQIFFHRMGTAQADDILVYHLPDRPAMNPTPTLTDDGAYIVVSAWQHLNGNSITVLPINPPGAPVTLIESDDYEVNFAGNVGERFYFTTNHAAPRGRVIAVDLSAAGVEQEIIPQFDDAILTGYSGGAAVCGGKLVVRTMQDVTSRLAIYTLDGQHERDITLPTLGNIPMMTIIDQADPDFYFYFESFAYPPTIFRCEVATGALQIIHQPKTLIDPASITVEQVFYPSKDGTRIPMFLVYRKGLQKDGQVPVYINAYGGFSIAMQPGFAPTPWLEMGGVLAIPGLRGGGEYGEEWHQAGMFERKQNVFDDLHAAAEYLIREGWTHSGRIGIKGGSNGGLLTSAAITQRPDLYGAAVVGVPLTDMLRFQHFTIARFWVPEYGSSEDPAQFEYLLKYSPLHNIKPGTAYPPTFIQTGAGDNRVVPAHAYKFAAAMQAAQASDAPILMHVEMRAGHGIGKPLSLQLDDATDQIVFFMQAFGMAKS